jgi:hypothetical protein
MTDIIQIQPYTSCLSPAPLDRDGAGGMENEIWSFQEFQNDDFGPIFFTRL